MKKRLAFVLSAVLLLICVVLLLSLSACGGQPSDPGSAGGTQQGGEPAAGDDVPDSDAQDPDASDTEDGDPVVYMTTDITPEGLMSVYEKLNWQPSGRVAVKLSTGEPPASNYLRP